MCTATMPETVTEAAARWLTRPASCRIEGAGEVSGSAISCTVTQVWLSSPCACLPQARERVHLLAGTLMGLLPPCHTTETLSCALCPAARLWYAFNCSSFVHMHPTVIGFRLLLRRSTGILIP